MGFSQRECRSRLDKQRVELSFLDLLLPPPAKNWSALAGRHAAVVWLEFNSPNRESTVQFRRLVFSMCRVTAVRNRRNSFLEGGSNTERLLLTLSANQGLSSSENCSQICFPGHSETKSTAGKAGAGIPGIWPLFSLLFFVILRLKELRIRR